MATSLSLQLKHLHTAQTSILDHAKIKASLLFSSSQAASLSRDEVFKIGYAGYLELLKLNGAFSKFKMPLFDEKSKSVQRSVQTKDYNESLDRFIDEFLIMLQPYLEKTSAFKAMEWLVHRYMINEMNVDSLMRCILPYYETNLFVRVLQILALNKSESSWGWLSTYKKRGVPLPKRTVLMRWASDQWFRNFVSKSFKKIWTINKGGDLRVAISFLITTIVGGIHSLQQVKEEHLSSITTTIALCRKSEHEELIAGIYFLLIHLSVKEKLSESFLNKILVSVCQQILPNLTERCALCLLVMFHHQSIATIPQEALLAIRLNKPIIHYITSLAREKCIARFLSPFINGVIRWMFSDCCSLSEEERLEEFNYLINLISSTPFSPNEASKVISSFSDCMLEHTGIINKMSKFPNIKDMLWEFEKSHPEGCDEAAAKLLLLSAEFKNKGGMKEKDILLSESDILLRLDSEDPDLILEVLKSSKNIANTLDSKVLKAKCLAILKISFLKPGKKFRKVNSLSLSILVNTVYPLLKQEEKDNLFYDILPYLLFIENKENVYVILNSGLAKGFSFLIFLKSILKSHLADKMNDSIQKWVKYVDNALVQVLGQLNFKDKEALLEGLKESVNTCAKDTFAFSAYMSLLLKISYVEKKKALKQRAIDILMMCCKQQLLLKVKIEEEEEEGEQKDVAIWMKIARRGCFPRSLFLASLEGLGERISYEEELRHKSFWLIDMQTNVEFMDLMLNVFEILSSAILHNDNKVAEDLFPLILKSFFKGHLKDLKQQLYFLSLIWGWHPELKCEGRSVSTYLKLSALNLGASLLKSSRESLSFFFDSKETLFASLLVPLSQGIEPLSTVAFKGLRALAVVPGGPLKNGCLSALLNYIIEFQCEISLDVSFLPSVFCNFVSTGKKEGLSILHDLMDLLCDERVPTHIRVTLLYCLSTLDEKLILERLEPTGAFLLNQADSLKEGESLTPLESLFLYYILLRLSSFDVSHLQRKGGRDLFLRCIKRSKVTMQVTDHQFSPLDLVITSNLLKQISDSDLMLHILNVLLTQAINSDNPQEAGRLRKLLKKVPLDASLVVQFIEGLQLIPKVASVKDSRAKKILQQSKKTTQSNDAEWRKLGLMVELIGVISNLSEPWLLLGSLCTHLKQTISLETTFSDTLQQQILSLIHHLVQMASNTFEKDEFLKVVRLDVVVLIQCIRTSINPDTHRRALLILALAADYYPDVVLHNILTIFTFMGSSLLRRDDSYSFQVIEQTVTSIVPTLIKSENKNQGSLLPKLTQVTQVFVDALPDLPEHRKLPLFLQLTTTLGASQYLWLVGALIMDTPILFEGEAQSRKLSMNIQFVLRLYSHFPVPDQLRAVSEILEFVYQLPDDKESYQNMNRKSKSPYTLIISIKKHSSSQLKHLKHACLSLLIHLLSSNNFINQVLEVTSQNEYSPQLEVVYECLLKNALRYFEEVVAKERSSKNSSTEKFYAVMHRKVVDLINCVNNLLPPELLCQVILKLLSFDAPLIRLRALELLATKLQPSVEFFRDTDKKNLVPFIGHLVKIGMDSSETEENRQNSFYVTQLLVFYFGGKESSHLWLPVLASTTKLIQKKDVSLRVQSSAILVVAECIQTLKEMAVPCLDSIMNVLMEALDKAVKEGIHRRNSLNLSASATALDRISENMPLFLSKYLDALLCVVCKLSHLLNTSSQKESGLSNCLFRIRACLTSTIPHRILIPAIQKTYGELSTKNVSAVPVLIEIIDSFIVSDPNDIVLCKNTFLTIFTSALDLRNTLEVGDSEDFDRIEERTISTLGNFLLKLNEDENVTIFTSLSLWAWEHIEDTPTRMLTFFRFSDYLVSIFKVLFLKAKLAERVMTLAASVMERNNVLHHETTIFGTHQHAEELTCELLNCVFDNLTKIFLYDSINFTTEERFNAILKPLIDQLENKIGGEKVFMSRVKEHLKPCIIQLAIATGDDSLWRELNRLLLLRVRNDEEPTIILASLDTFEGLIDKLGEDYLQPLLADIMTYITEVLESLDAEVEDRARKIFNKLESILGESLKMYLES